MGIDNCNIQSRSLGLGSKREANPDIYLSTLQSKIIGKGLREMVPAGRGKLQRKIRVPISNNLAQKSIVSYMAEPIWVTFSGIIKNSARVISRMNYLENL